MWTKLALIAIGLAIFPGNRVAIAQVSGDNSVLIRQLSGSAVHDNEHLGWDEQIWGHASQTGDRHRLLQSIDHSLRYLQTPAATQVYAQYAIPGFTLDRVQRSLERFRQLVVMSPSPEALQAAVLREFDLYQSIGTDGLGTVEFTGYFEPTYQASRTPTADYRYPLYRLPPDIETWPDPHPTRSQLEGDDGLQSDRRLRGLELVWLRDRLEAFLVQVQGSARLQLTDGTTMSIGYAGRTQYSYTSIGRELVNDGKIPEAELSLPAVIDYFRFYPADLNSYLSRNNRFVFFRETFGAPPTGSLGVPVTAERSIATDKSIMPPGALALIQTHLPLSSDSSESELESRWVSRYVLDQDTGGAIRGAGRVDIFMGTGQSAGDRAGLVNSRGRFYYLLVKDSV
ncbi:MAG TPA: murein transglycosylase A [Elainellaceae cyanobacterium]